MELVCDVDDATPQVLGHVLARLLEAGALDATLSPLLMKKNRPGLTLTALCDEARLPEVEELILRETTSLGVRRHPVSRRVLNRRAHEVATEFGPLKGKLAWFPSNPGHARFSPEYEDCVRVAAERGVPLREVYEAALRGFTAGPAPERP